MRPACCTLALVFAAACVPPIANAQTLLTLPDVLIRARERAPQIVSARLAVEEARAKLTGASLRLQSNPELDGTIGYRSASLARSTDVEVGLSQMFEPGGRRTARVASATAAIDRGTATVDETTRLALRAAAAAFFRALHASERIRLLDSAADLAVRVHDAADRRFRAGDIAVLDVNIARATLARVRADREAAAAEREADLADIKILLNIEGAVEVQGNLASNAAPAVAGLIESALQRPDSESSKRRFVKRKATNSWRVP